MVFSLLDGFGWHFTRVASIVANGLCIITGAIIFGICSGL